ncbi:RecF/RecN/SMC N-terminal domain-containing protein [Mycobacteroides abscessus subsp. massiliense]|uniref:Rad50/SbcC-type AAA domain-containing protein n=1 Tax=Mycolicibacterium fortuitum subsp. acetamidolyticum TaxID=144550 RepID=A0A100WXX7_MYCFO|nr:MULTISPECIES: ATP-binding protein [Mycobacteriaceae]MCV7143869.1 AAA family ATPase [Mycolicibacterium fortuitum]SKM23152.1 RecF/RecN/SMC N-terminal domain-containing protein [Mycobacteroides abscessus subsp. abscessus]SKM87475.1 RecF/RecN/SMC N-terminal domain-containing protein [Mycobacteroides abscessus subsp. massiliense]SKN98833.1 RecF/RecN/SMC N-terminal domain-containing protein [Mycobacteroides abscessus subsp. massiliense]SKO00474.1 RecF/RecN/SMC N-terminal domain-containing protein
MTHANTSARLVSLEIRGFRAFGTEPRTLDLDAGLVVIHAGNSQGKTSLAEAIEFLISGRSSRRELLGGAKAEYNDSLRNAHLADSDTDVYVQAVIRDAAGNTHQVRRELLCDFGQGTECESRLLIDGAEADDLAGVGLALADPPVRAPVLLQHILRHVLSTEPKQRVGYFKALLSLTDLDSFRERVRAARGRVEAEQPGAALQRVNALNATPAASAGTAISALTKKPLATDAARTAVDKALRAAGGAILADAEGVEPVFETVDDLAVALGEALDAQRERAFPLSAFAVTELSEDPVSPDLEPYATALAEFDQHTARLTPVLDALLGIEEYAQLDHAATCPVCGTDDALTPDRIDVLRDHLRRTRSLGDVAKTAAEALATKRHELDQFSAAAAAATPAVATWTDEQLAAAADALRSLRVDVALLTATRAAAAPVATAAADLAVAVAAARRAVEETSDAVGSRQPLPEGLAGRYLGIDSAARRLREACADYSTPAAVLRSAVEDAARERITISGLTELADLVAVRTELITDVVTEAIRQRTIRRLTAADKALRDGAGAVLDGRFAQMSDTITKWWSTIRPEELVGFGGIKRRAAGALFVNLIADLRVDATSTPVEREALGVYSDSQLNALGLSIFLARTELLGAPIVVLDDPIPGSDAGHRLTFVQYTLGALLAAGTQVILTTFDSKLAEWSYTNHGGADFLAYKLDLIDIRAGTEPTQTTDTFGQLMLEAEESLHAPTAKGRRSACNTMRSAAERLAKQIIATGMTDAGTPTTITDVEAKATQLGDLLTLLYPFVVEGNSEKGQWKTLPKVLNPGSHDDDVPSTTELKVVFGNLRHINKTHQKHWTDGLIK